MRVMEPEDAVTTPAAGVVVRSAWQRRILTFLMVFGPGLIVMEADNDAGAVSTYMQAGGQYGLHLLWLLVVLLPICYFIQEMVARLPRPRSLRSSTQDSLGDFQHKWRSKWTIQFRVSLRIAGGWWQSLAEHDIA
jgi:hypothetical protein